VHAVAGIGHPPRFFAQLRALGIEVIEHAFADHYRFRAADLAFMPPAPVVMTEKDAVKCEAFAQADHWYLAVAARPDAGLAETILNLLREKLRGQETTRHPGVPDL
jgi:tetraacyldisaccharide 4'-kinase